MTVVSYKAKISLPKEDTSHFVLKHDFLSMKYLPFCCLRKLDIKYILNELRDKSDHEINCIMKLKETIWKMDIENDEVELYYELCGVVLHSGEKKKIICVI